MTERTRAIGVNHIALEVGDVDEALELYGRIFAFDLRGRAGRMAFVDLGDQFIALAPGVSDPPTRHRHIGLVVEDVQAALDAARDAGLELRGTTFIDPWGNQFQVVAYSDVQFTKAPRGARGNGPGRAREVRLRPRRAAHEGAPLLTYELVRELPLEIESYELDGLALSTQAEWTRRTTVIHLRGGGEEGIGEDVTYDEDHQLALQREGLPFRVEGEHTLDSFSELVADAPGYERWGLESAALDLALRQAGLSLAGALGREPQPVTFVVSFRLGDPPSIGPVRRRLSLYPNLRFKLDPEAAWTDDLIAELAATGALDTADLKGMYQGTVVDQPPDPELYRRVAEGFPGAWIEDPALTPETDPVLEPHRDRITWDAPIHSVADIEALPFPPRTINVKPSRFGSVRELFATYDYLAEHGMGAYGGGQYELGPGRGQIEHLASLFHPDAPNDVAPVAYHEDIRPGLPESPLQPATTPTGFRWD